MTQTYALAGVGDDLPADAHLREITNFTLNVLPTLNSGCRNEAVSMQDWMRVVSAVTANPTSTYTALRGASADRLVQLTGFVVCSAERHLQAKGGVAGDAMAALPHLAEMLATARGDGRWPYPTAYSVWLDDDVPFTFTGEPHHKFFRNSVRAQVTSHAAANTVLRDLADRTYPIGSSHGTVMTAMAVGAVAAARRQYQTMKHDLTYMQFNEFRGWLPATSLDGVVYAGPNAAWLHEMMRTDIVLGVADATYISMNVLPALPYVTQHGRAVIMRDIGAPSAIDTAAEAIGLEDAAVLGTCPVSLVTNALAETSEKTRTTIVGLVEIWKTIVGASAAHIGEIERCLQRPEFTEDELAAMAVKPDRGTGGHAHDDTRRIHDMRRTNTAFVNLAAALKALG